MDRRPWGRAMPRLTLAVLLIACPAAPAAPPPQVANSEKEFQGLERARDLIKGGEYGRARDLLLMIRRPLEDSGSWNNLLGYAEFKLNRPQAALPHLQKALVLEPDNEDFLFDMGEFLIHQRATAAAREMFEAAARRMPGSKRVQLLLAVGHMQDNRYAEAEALLNALLKLDPDFEPAYSAIGEFYEQAGKWEALVWVAEKLLARQPSSGTGWYLKGLGLAWLAVQNGMPLDPAIETLQRASQFNPHSSRTHFALAKVFQWQENYRLAILELEQTIRLDPLHDRAHYVLATLYRRSGKTELADRELQIHDSLKQREGAVPSLIRPRVSR